ncbi:putative minor core protein [Aedes camptorhynchus reo-like virus]|uniref:putative minor core protein n=1 Tax=Aedes camptorhynchus reo-like virus TaxID=2010269 RepID=UPI000B5BD49A|nr:putative minor core protein [Aedes camptorhynchus reo-like virus]ASA47355.1 putative minor core protein [Aedes camptorhynchus reo-like virus]
MSTVVQEIPRNEYLNGKEIITAIFSCKRRRSGHVIVVGYDERTLLRWKYQISASVGAKVAYARVRHATDTEELSHAVRELTPNLLNDTCVLMLYGDHLTISLDFARKLSASIRAGLLYLPQSSASSLEEQCMMLRNNLPDPTIPVFGVLTPTNLERSISPELKAEFRDNLAVSQCARELTIAFQVFRYRQESRALNSIKTKDNTDVIVNIVGYTPTLVHATLRSGARPVFYDPAFPKFTDLICPPLTTLLTADHLRRKKDSGWVWVRTNPQKKIALTAYLGLSLATQVLYIGSFPGTNLLDLQLTGHNLILIDPAIDDQYRLRMMKVCPNVSFKQEKYDFTVDHFNSLIQNRFDTSRDIVILNDAWIEGEAYELFQRNAFDHFSELCSRFGNVTIISKFHLLTDYKLTKVKALLPQPHGGSTNEMRIIFGGDGKDYHYRSNKVNLYMEDFKSLNLTTQLWCINFYYHYLVKREDILKIDPGYNNIYSCLFSLSNDMNRKKDVLKWLSHANLNHNSVIFTTPNRDRAKVLVDSNFNPRTNISIKKDLFTFNSPVREIPWKDVCYTPSEMSEVLMECVTLEAFSGTMGKFYTGAGCYTQSSTFDLYDIYVSHYVIRPCTQVQHVGTSPLGFVKAFTHLFLKHGGMRRQAYYTNRGILLRRFFVSMNVPSTAYRLVGTEKCTMQILERIVLTSKYGIVRIFPNTEVNLSGHLLAMFVAAHFVSVSFEMWIRQLIHMATDVPSHEIDIMGNSPLEFFDNVRNGTTYLHWHTINELILTAEIVPEYVSSVMMGRHSESVISTHLKHFQDILLPIMRA